MRRPLGLLLAVIAFVALLLLITWRDSSLPSSNPVIVYFGRPHDTLAYFSANWQDLGYRSLKCLFTAIVSLGLAGGVALLLLALGLLSDGWLAPIERLAAASQAVPILVIVTFALIIELSLFRSLELSASITIYCLGPVTLGLLFPPLVYGAEAVLRLSLEIKALLRLWDTPTHWRILHVYLPVALPSVLTGVRTSATWAVSATIITEGMLHGIDGDSSTLGHLLLRPFSSGAPGRTPAVIIVATVLGFAVYQLFVHLQGFIERWLLGTVVETEQSYPLQSRR